MSDLLTYQAMRMAERCGDCGRLFKDIDHPRGGAEAVALHEACKDSYSVCGFEAVHKAALP